MIQVGDTVKWIGDKESTVLAIHDSWAWIQQHRHPNGEGYTSVRLHELTRIYPEVLRPKYKKGQLVNAQGRHDNPTPIRHIWIAYNTASGTFGEDDLEPAPDPCPTCKGTGVAE